MIPHMEKVMHSDPLAWPPLGDVQEVGWLGLGHPTEHAQHAAVELARRAMGDVEWVEGPLFRENHKESCRDPQNCEWGVWGLVRVAAEPQ